MNNYPLVNVITVCYNSENTITNTIESVLMQKYTNIHYYIVDGASTDSTCTIIERYLIDNPNKITILSEKDSGIYDAMNKGINMIDDENSYIVFLNSDDYFYSDNSISDVIMLSNNIDFIYGKINVIKGNKQITFGKCMKRSEILTKYYYHPSIFAKKRLFNLVGNFDTSYRIASDYKFCLDVSKLKNVTFKYIPIIVTTMRSGGISNTQVQLSNKERLEIIKGRFNIIQYVYAYINIVIVLGIMIKVRNILIKSKINLLIRKK